MKMLTLLRTIFIVLFVICKEFFVDGFNITTDHVNLYLYTRKNPIEPQKINVADSENLNTSNFDPLLTNYFIIHGIFGNYKDSLYAKDPLLGKNNVNVFLVDYSVPGSFISLHDKTIIAAGKYLAEFIKYMKESYKLLAEKFVLVGFSMGAHIAGEIGKNLDGDIGTIVALDPANMTPPIVYIDSKKAHYVQSLHTSKIGLRSPVGHASFFPNTVYQPGCDSLNQFCCHQRAVELYGESLITGGFNAVKCDSYDFFQKGLCDDNEKSYFGRTDLDKRASGTYYLRTNSEPPYSLD